MNRIDFFNDIISLLEGDISVDDINKTDIYINYMKRQLYYLKQHDGAINHVKFHGPTTLILELSE